VYPEFASRSKGKRFFRPTYDYSSTKQRPDNYYGYNSTTDPRAQNPNAALGDGGGEFLGGKSGPFEAPKTASKFASRFRAGVKMLEVPLSGSGGMPVIGVERLEKNIQDRMLGSKKSRQHLERVCQNFDRSTNSRIQEQDFQKIFKVIATLLVLWLLWLLSSLPSTLCVDVAQELKFLVAPVDISALFMKYAKVPDTDNEQDQDQGPPTLDVVKFVSRFVPESHIRETAKDQKVSAFEAQRPKVRSNVWF